MIAVMTEVARRSLSAIIVQRSRNMRSCSSVVAHSPLSIRSTSSTRILRIDFKRTPIGLYFTVIKPYKNNDIYKRYQKYQHIYPLKNVNP